MVSFPTTEKEMYCEHCGTFFTAEGRYVRCSFDDPNDVDFGPEPRCPNCSSHDCIDEDDVPVEEISRRDEELVGDILDRDQEDADFHADIAFGYERR